MDYEFKISAIEKLIKAAKDNIQTCEAGDQVRSSYTCGKIAGMVEAMQLSGQKMEYGPWRTDNGCLIVGFLSADGLELIKNGAIQMESVKAYKQSLLPITKVTIYQINNKRDYNDVCFINHEHLQRFQGTPLVDSSIYDRVYSGDLHCSSLENIYQILNEDHPENYRARSLSVSDVIQVENSPIMKDGFYFCDSFGFMPVQFEPAKTQDGPYYDSATPLYGKVLVIEPGKEPEIREMSLNLKSLQRAVGGCIDACYPYEDPVAIIQIEDRNAGDVSLNRALWDLDGDIVHVTAGTMLVVGLSNNNFAPLTEKHLEKYERLFHTPEAFHYQDGRLTVEKVGNPKAITHTKKSWEMER